MRVHSFKTTNSLMSCEQKEYVYSVSIKLSVINLLFHLCFSLEGLSWSSWWMKASFHKWFWSVCHFFCFSSGKHFVDKHRCDLIQRVTNISSIVDELFDKDVISQENYEKIRALPTLTEKVRTLYDTSLNAEQCKDIFYDVLVANEKFLVKELSGKK